MKQYMIEEIKDMRYNRKRNQQMNKYFNSRKRGFDKRFRGGR